jgi:hypothetical protein
MPIALVFVFLSMLATMPVQGAGNSMVTVRDNEFRILKTIASDTDVSLFSDLWSKKKREPYRAPITFAYKIDIQLKPKGGRRWLYDPAGVVQVLSKQEVPSFRLESPEHFNRLLGIK